jgi:hypothetical protein
MTNKNSEKNQMFAPKFFNMIRGKKKITKEKNETKKKSDSQLSPTISWTAREYIKKERSPNWYIYAGITAIILIITAFWLQSVIMVITFILMIAVVYYMADKEPNNVMIDLSPKGISIDNRLYLYKELKSFWLFYDPPYRKVLSIIPEKVFMPQIRIQLESQSPVLIRKYLLRYLLEEEQPESLLENLADRMKL